MTHNLYALHVYDTAGVKQAIVTDFLALAYVRRVNHPGIIKFALTGDHPILTTLQDKWELEVWRKPETTGEWRREIVGIFRDEEWTYPASGSRFTGLAYGINSKLANRIVNWHADRLNRTKFYNTRVEIIMKLLTITNIGSQALQSSGRKRDGIVAGITNQTDQGGVEVIDYFCFGKNLLDALQELANTKPGDFDLVKTGAGTYQFRFYEGQLGTDKTATVTFALHYGNMGNPKYKHIRSIEKTVAAVWGQGEREDRAYVTRLGPNYDAVLNNAEVFIDAKDITGEQSIGEAALNSRGDSRLNEMKADPEFSFDVLQTPSTEYGIHYDLGDLVTAINPFNGESISLKVNAIGIVLESNGAETVNVELGKLIT